MITAPAADLNARQYFKLFEKFMLGVGMSPCSIRSGAMSLVFNDYVDEKEQRKVCKEYELTMDEDLEKKYQEYKERDEEVKRLQEELRQRVILLMNPRLWVVSQRFIGYTDEQLEVMVDMYEQSKLNGLEIWSEDAQKYYE